MLEKLVAKSRWMHKKAHLQHLQSPQALASQLDTRSPYDPDITWSHCHPTLKRLRDKYSSPASPIALSPLSTDDEEPTLEPESELMQAIAPSRLRSQARNFDFGTMAVDLDDHNWMTWF